MSAEIEISQASSESYSAMDSWHEILLGNVAMISTGKKDVNEGNPSGDYPFFTCSRIHGYSDSYSFDAEAILVAGNGDVGGLQYYCGKFEAYQRTYVLTGFRIHTKFLWHQLNYALARSLGIGKIGSSIPYIKKENLTLFKFLSPSNGEEMDAIASALSDMDSLISSLDQIIAKKRAIKQATMQQLLTGQIRLPGFGGEWRKLRLEAICAFITKGSTPTTYGFGWESSGILFLRSECVAEQGLDLSQSMYISSAAHNTLHRSEICGGDLLITITGNVGRVILLPDGFPTANINQHIARVRVTSQEADSRFVYHFLSVPGVRKQYNSITTGQAYPQISLKQVRETEIRLPALTEQVAIAQILSEMDDEIAALDFRREKAKRLKQGMMQELLTGRIRLV